MKDLTLDEVTHRNQNKKLIDELESVAILYHASNMLSTRIAEALYKHIPTLDQACYERGCPCIDSFEEIAK
jgi:hypothetical protein